MKIYKVALIGCGQMGAVHMDHIYYKENVQVEYVCDKIEERALLFQRKYHAAHAVCDIAPCLEDPAVDIVIIAVYPSQHLSILEQCLAHKKHVLCEKPIAADLASGRRFLEEIRQHPECKVLVGHILRHNATYQKVAALIHEGAIGHPIVMRMAQNHHTMNRSRYLSLMSETSPIIDCGVHYMDVMQWFTQEKITEISGIGARVDDDVPAHTYGYGLVTVKLSGGSIGYYEAGWTNTISANNTKEFVGPKGRIILTYEKDRTANSEEGDLIELYRYPEKTYETINIPGDRKPCDVQFDYLIKMIEQGAPSVPSLEELEESFSAVIKADAAIKAGLPPLAQETKKSNA